MNTRGSLLIARGRKADNFTFSYPRLLSIAKVNAAARIKGLTLPKNEVK